VAPPSSSLASSRSTPLSSPGTRVVRWSTSWDRPSVRRPFLGVEVQSPFSGISGAIVEVVPSGPAANAGIVPGDIVTAVSGQAIASPARLGDLLLGECPMARCSCTTSICLGYKAPWRCNWPGDPHRENRLRASTTNRVWW